MESVIPQLPKEWKSSFQCHEQFDMTNFIYFYVTRKILIYTMVQKKWTRTEKSRVLVFKDFYIHKVKPRCISMLDSIHVNYYGKIHEFLWALFIRRVMRYFIYQIRESELEYVLFHLSHALAALLLQ